MKANKQKVVEAFQELERIEAVITAAEAFFDNEDIPQVAYKYYAIRRQLQFVLEDLENVLQEDDRYNLLPF